MPNPYFCPRRTVHIFAQTRIVKHFVETKRVVRITSLFLIYSLLLSSILIAPFQVAKSSSRLPVLAPLNSPPEPFQINKLQNGIADSSIWATGLLTNPSNFLNESEAQNAISLEQPFSLTGRFATLSSSLISLIAPDTKIKIPEPKTVVSDPNAAVAPMMTAPGGVTFDFDGDGRADVGRWHPATHEFKIKSSLYNTHLSNVNLGTYSSKPVPGDFNGDGKTDIAIYNSGSTTNPGTWYYIQSPITATATPQPLGTPMGISGDIPAVGDYDGDGKSDQALYRPSNGRWYINQSTNGYIEHQDPTTGNIPIPGNYDTDNKTDRAVFRSTGGSGYWDIYRSSAGSYSAQWGMAGDTPVQGDFNGDGKNDLAVYRSSDGTWYAATIAGGTFNELADVGWGNYGDQPVPADYDGDGITDCAVWRPSTGVWYIRKSDMTELPVPPYLYRTLGVSGDTALPSSYIKQIGSVINPGVDGAKARLAPRNATGGTNLYSQNFSWGQSLVSLPGRSGLNAGLGISYNSLVWLKNDTTMYFDPDKSNVSPGFRFGFPVIEPIYYDKPNGTWFYMMVTPDGSRKQFRQIAASNGYEATDSSYTHLETKGATNPNDPVENIEIEIKGTDGSQISYGWRVDAYKCTQILDRNGNYISISYTEQGLLHTVTDTLGRVITVNYDPQLYPSSIKQSWSTGQHTWASFSYGTATVNTDFGGDINTVVGPPDGTAIKVLEKITYADGSKTKFDYNDYLQVNKVSTIAADSPLHVLNYIRTAFDPGAQSDCPRFTHTFKWAENFNLINGVPQEIDVENTPPDSSEFRTDNFNEETAVVRVTMAGHPNNLYSRLHFGRSDQGWKEGLPLATEDCTDSSTDCSERKRWTWTKWEQDQEGGIPYNYVRNPRVIESQVGDDTSNVKRTTMTYLQDPTVIPNIGAGDTVAYFGLISEINVFGTDLNTVKKKQVTEYNLHPLYLNKRLIGLPLKVEAWGWNDDPNVNSLEYVSKITYGYDEGDFSDATLMQNISPVQHASYYYGASFSRRGNLTSTTRWDVLGESPSVISSVKYNTTGSPVSQTDPLGRVTKIGYTDSFSTIGNPTTYAYPTTITDPAGSLGDPAHSSTVKYRYDIGANIEATSPAPAGNTLGKKSKRNFDVYGRLDRESIYVGTVEKTYTRYVYPTNGIQSKVYSTVMDFNNNGGPDTADEVLSESWFDGAGRIRQSRSAHPGSFGGWSATKVVYDILGRAKRQSVPTEVSVSDPNDPESWAPSGDDEIRGYLWTYQKYDWKGRVIRKINTDGTDSPTLNDSDVLISYEGCGCAGGQVTTIENERVPKPGTTGEFGRRTQRVYADELGRTYKTEVLNWSGSVYSTTVDSFNGRDQVINTRQFAGAEGSSVYRDVTMTYDGHGRMETRHYPIEDAGANTTWNYNPDDTIHKVTDPRGVKTTFGYNSRGMVTGISYDPDSTGVEDTPDVTFAYDNIGNRTSMTDGTGSTSYVYNSLSQMTSETKTISEINNSFTINYTYSLNGTVQTYSDPQNSDRKVEYFHDKIGRILETKVSHQTTLEQRLHGTQYRAWGALKKHTFDKIGSASTFSQSVEFEYDNRLQLSRNFASYTPNQSGYWHDVEYTRNADGKLRESDDTIQQAFSRNFEYDNVGRVTKSLSGFTVHGQGTEAPYRMALEYNSFSETTHIVGKQWEGSTSYYTPQLNPSTGRINVSIYDASGNVLQEAVYGVLTQRIYSYDAAGRNLTANDPGARPSDPDRYVSLAYDGNGWRVKKQTFSDNVNYDVTEKVFEISSTVLGGQTVGTFRTDDNPNIPDKKTFEAMANGVKFTNPGGPVFGGYSWTSPDGITAYDDYFASAEFDPRGGNVGTENPNSGYGGGGYPAQNDGALYERCAEGGVPQPCDKQAQFNIAFARLDALMQVDAASRRLREKSEPPQLRSLTDTMSTALTRYTSKSASNSEKDDPIPRPSLPEGCVYGSDGQIICKVDVEVSWTWPSVNTSQSLINTNWTVLARDLERDFETVRKRLTDISKPPTTASSKLWGLKAFGSAKEECEQYVLTPLASIGFNLNGFLDYLGKGSDFFDGSSALGRDANEFYANNNPSPPIPAGWSVAMFFVRQPNSSAITSISKSSSKLTTGFNPRNANSSTGLLFHEALHGYGASLNNGQSAGAFSDGGLMSLFGLKGTSTSQITQYINDHCGAYFNGTP